MLSSIAARWSVLDRDAMPVKVRAPPEVEVTTRRDLLLASGLDASALDDDDPALDAVVVVGRDVDGLVEYLVSVLNACRWCLRDTAQPHVLCTRRGERRTPREMLESCRVWLTEHADAFAETDPNVANDMVRLAAVLWDFRDIATGSDLYDSLCCLLSFIEEFL